MSEGIETKGYYQLEIAARMVGLPPSRVRSYVRMGLFPGQASAHESPGFGELELMRLRKIRRLTVDLGLNPAGVEIALRLLDEVAALRAELEQRSRAGW